MNERTTTSRSCGFEPAFGYILKVPNSLFVFVDDETVEWKDRDDRLERFVAVRRRGVYGRSMKEALLDVLTFRGEYIAKAADGSSTRELEGAHRQMHDSARCDIG